MPCTCMAFHRGQRRKCLKQVFSFFRFFVLLQERHFFDKSDRLSHYHKMIIKQQKTCCQNFDTLLPKYFSVRKRFWYLKNRPKMNQINESCLAQKRFKFGQKKQSRLGHYHTEVNHFVFKL